MNSATVFAGTDGCTSITFGPSARPATGTMSVRKLYGSFLYSVALIACGGDTQQQRVAVGRRVDHGLRRHIAAAARPVLHHHLLTEAFRQRLRDDPRHDVGRTAGRKA